jgi:hypothetical protein
MRNPDRGINPVERHELTYAVTGNLFVMKNTVKKRAEQLNKYNAR